MTTAAGGCLVLEDTCRGADYTDFECEKLGCHGGGAGGDISCAVPCYAIPCQAIPCETDCGGGGTPPPTGTDCAIPCQAIPCQAYPCC